MEQKSKEIIGLGVFWAVASGVASLLPPTAGAVVGVIIAIVVVAGLGSIVLSVFLGGDGFDHLFAGFMLGLAGLAVTHFGFGWDLYNPADVWDAESKAQIRKDASNPSHVPANDPGWMWGSFLVTMIENTCIVAVGMAIVAIPMVPVIWKLQKSSLDKPAPPVPPNQSSTLAKPPAKGDA